MESDLATQSLTLYVINKCVLTFHHIAGFFFGLLWTFSIVADWYGCRSTIMITFKRIDSAMLKLTLSCLKSIVVWNTCAIKRVY